MKRTWLLGLILMVGMVAADNNLTTPDEFIPGNINSADLSTPVTFNGDATGDNTFEEYITLPAPPGADAFTFTVVNCSSVSWLGTATPLRGMDIVNLGEAERIMSPVGDSLYFLDMNDGTRYSACPLDTANEVPFGCYTYSSINVNDRADIVIYRTPNMGVSWLTTVNPAGNYGRGMDVDPSTYLVWETYSSTGVYSFDHLSGTGTFHNISAHVPDQMSGLAVFAFGMYHYLIVNCYNSNYAYFFDLENSLNYLGAAEYPYSSTFFRSYGLTFSYLRHKFFWSFRDNTNNCYLVELELSGLSLERSTWGEIKSSF